MSQPTGDNVDQRNPGDGCETATDSSTAPAGSASAVGPQSTANTTATNPGAAAIWSANSELLESIVNLGFNKLVAEKALFYTGNNSLEKAVNWIIDYGQGFDDGNPLDISKVTLGPADTADPNMVPHKMVFIVNSTLKMGIGKIAAQVGHATLGLYRDLLETPGKETALLQWTEEGETKVVLKSDGGEEELAGLMQSAKRNSLHTYLVADAGRTQIAAGSITVLSIFGASDRVDEITGKLKLLQ